MEQTFAINDTVKITLSSNTFKAVTQDMYMVTCICMAKAESQNNTVWAFNVEWGF